jgi:hypothetical protein
MNLEPDDITSLRQQLAQAQAERDGALSAIEKALSDDLSLRDLAAHDVEPEGAWRVARDVIAVLSAVPTMALAKAKFDVWAEAYQQGVDDERESEMHPMDIGFGVMKLEPARENPHGRQLGVPRMNLV